MNTCISCESAVVQDALRERRRMRATFRRMNRKTRHKVARRARRVFENAMFRKWAES